MGPPLQGTARGNNGNHAAPDAPFPGPEPKCRVIVGPPSHVLSGERFNRPLVVLGPLRASYWHLTLLNMATGDDAELIYPQSVEFATGSVTESSGESGGSAGGSSPARDPTEGEGQGEGQGGQGQSRQNRPHRMFNLQVGTTAPTPSGYVTDPELLEVHEEPQGWGYAVWPELSIEEVGPQWTIWVRAMDERDDPIGAVKTTPVRVQAIGTEFAVPQPETFPIDQMKWLQRLQIKNAEHEIIAPFKDEFWGSQDPADTVAIDGVGEDEAPD
ncbi:hypothetical protein PGQ11_005377 [Apiospora arundinis]|uniref:Uncharacterized protein n=1 Tax=Apiospora arundinis TaxID=335852 RepID=A0ABR2JBA2_9PEZI